jgi:protein involved in polysaccharide export with SLBB domain
LLLFDYFLFPAPPTAACRIKIRWALLRLGAFLIFSPILSAQTNTPGPTQMPSSELGRQNLSRVSASAGEIKAVLFKDVGLMVELKRWVAKDATDHGQVVTEADLTNDAIFDRLEQDVQFRAVATQLCQRYGYLVPQLNPTSAQARQQELLIQERTKWIAAHEEQARLDQAQMQQNNRQPNGCTAQSARAGDCNPSQIDNQTDQSAPQPGGSDNGNAPKGRPATQPRQSQLEYTDFLNTGDQYANTFAAYPSDGSYDYNESLLQEGIFSGQSALPSQRFSRTGDSDSSGTSGEPSLQNSLFSSSGDRTSTPNSMSGIGSVDSLPIDPTGTNRVSPPEMGPGGNAGTDRSRDRFYSIRRGQPYPQTVEMVRRPNPYQDIPSLYDMYMQAPARLAQPRRFGMDIFSNGIRDSQMVPMDLPAGPDYVVGPGDGLAIDLWGGTSRRLIRTVDREGRVSLPEVGPVLVSGKSLTEVQTSIQDLLRSQLRDVSADVSLARLRTIRVYEVGDVAHPGAYDIGSLSTPLNALFAAEGPTSRGSLRLLKHYRGNQLIQTVDVYDLLLHGVDGDMQRLENGDTLLVPPIGPQVTVEGMVRRPAIYELKDEKNLASVLDLAGGLLPAAAVRHIEVQRLVAHEKKTMLSLDIREADNDAEVTKKLADFAILDGDQIRIFPIAPYNQDAIYLEGHALRPGRYSYRPDMRVTDIVASYQDLLPEPATQYAEIIRLNAPDFHPSVESFNLKDALANPAKAPVLQPMDTIRVFSRFDFEDPPTVAVLGDVRSPGTYQTSGAIRLTDAIHLAGGLAPDAQIENAQVFRYLPDGSSKIFSVSLTEALSGDPAANIALETRDRLIIHRDASDVEPSTVYIEGDVTKPGRYPWTNNMKVADLIRVGGGLKESADRQTADLTHFSWLDQSSSTKLTGVHEAVGISAALENDPTSNLPLHNGDVLTIRQLPGWNDLGASVTVRGEVKHPGTYGIRPGEKLSSVLERAGGFQSAAYPYGMIIQRTEVRDLEMKQQTELILRIKGIQSDLQGLPETTPDQKQSKEMALSQYQTTLEQLSANPPPGRVATQISGPIDRWRNTNADIEVRAGDTITLPKKPSYVMVTGQVLNPTAVSYRPGRSAKWYLSQSGGPTQVADKKGVFIIRADGSVSGSNDGLWSGPSLSAELRPGDTIVVPEKAYAGPKNWTNLLIGAQVAAAVGTAVLVGIRP